MERRPPFLVLLFVLSIATAWVVPAVVRAAPTVSLYGIHMDPADQDARNFSRSSYGGGLHVGVPIPQTGNLVAGAVAMEYVNMLSETHTFQDPKTGLRVEQQTTQGYFRLLLGPEIGPNGPGFFRPHVGAHVAVVNYSIGTDVVVPDDVNRENEIRQNLSSRSRTVMGYDFSAGTDLNFGNGFVEGGMRYAKSFNVPQQLGAGAVSIHPGYIQIYIGVGVNLHH